MVNFFVPGTTIVPSTSRPVTGPGNNTGTIFKIYSYNIKYCFHPNFLEKVKRKKKLFKNEEFICKKKSALFKYLSS